MTNEELWQTVLAQIQFSISRANFATWFKNTKIFSIEDGKAVVSVENSFSKEWLDNKYSSLILKSLRELDGNVKSIDFLISPEKNFSSSVQGHSKKDFSIPDSQLLFQELVVDQKTNLNSHYTFDNFVVGRFNEVAHAASWAVSENPGKVYNPLFLYGDVGLGKTHLLQATGNKIIELFPNKKIKYLPCERFISGMVDAIKNHQIDEFKKNLRDVDVLIMDDVQFFTGKEKSQEEFFHIFNLFHHSQKQIILSSDRSPKAIPALEERLRSRFEGGMLVDIGTPDIETRVAILKAKCEEKKMDIGEDVIEYIASNIRSSIRELEGALNRILFFKKVNNKPLDLDSAKKFLGNIISIPKKTTNFKKIIQTISDFYDLKEKEILLQTRRKEIVRPRQIAMYLLREELNESFPSIGRRFGGKDHTTAIYACLKIEKESKENDELMSEINLIRQKLYSGLNVKN